MTVHDIAFKTLGFEASKMSGISNTRNNLYLRNVKDDNVQACSHRVMSCRVDLPTPYCPSNQTSASFARHLTRSRDSSSN